MKAKTKVIWGAVMLGMCFGLIFGIVLTAGVLFEHCTACEELNEECMIRYEEVLFKFQGKLDFDFNNTLTQDTD